MSAKNPLILLIEDDPNMREILRSLLKAGGYRVLEAEAGEEGIRQAAEQTPDLILLDMCLPDILGLEVLSRLRTWTDTPVVIVTGEDSQDLKVRLLDAGADDYLTKPFGAAELLARVRVGLRHGARIQPDDADAVFVNGELRVDRASRQIFMGDEEIKLTPTEYRLLQIFIKHLNQSLTHREILEEVWGKDCVGRDHYVRVYMAHLRRKIEQNAAEPGLLVTVPGVGYRMRSVS
ncbi:response regulator [Bradymonas sediminis]|uniref:DNA-binding response regulator n=1 Tax=Bradymonas sediminis TaxID=1548548 RepID=A0A2Z4FGR3_9DELT|nr:response regulator transcription factor [Bradymonas sediminis]AWV88157.1 DNA-binding response regulator [Bradymonas sediminis]TDP77280.1 two-component system KDP operon response regulator KdpE [Bradymonas sediminis]